MKGIILGLAVLAVACIAFATQCPSAALPVPLLAWSTDARDRINVRDLNSQQQLEERLKTFVSPLSGNRVRLIEGTPETVVIVAHQTLRADEISRFGNAHAEASSGDAFSELKASLASAAHTSHAVSYFSAGRKSLSNFLRHDLARIAAWHGGNVFVGIEGEQDTRKEHEVTITDASLLPSLLNQHRVADNGKTDLVIVLLAGDELCNADAELTRARLSRQDALVGDVIRASGPRTIALLTADAAGAVPHHTASSARIAEHHRRNLLSAMSTVVYTTDTTNTTNATRYMTPPVAAGLAISGLGLLITLIGFCCLFTLTTQARFEGPEKTQATAGVLNVQ